MQLLVLQHVPFEGPASIRDWAEHNGVELCTHCCANDTDYPNLADFDGFIIMGGPMSVNDNLHWLAKEKAYIDRLLESDKPILGICLGAQLIADCLGATVKQHTQREIGWYPVKATQHSHWLAEALPATFTALHWHGDTFDIPANCIRLFSSNVCDNQAFSFGEKVIALQFHLEFDPDTATRVGQACADELADKSASVQSLEQILSEKARFTKANGLMSILLNHLFIR